MIRKNILFHLIRAAMIAGILICDVLLVRMLRRTSVYAEARFVREAIRYASV